MIDLIHDRDSFRESQDKELHAFVQTLAHRTGVTLAVHRDDIRRLVKLVTGDDPRDLRATMIRKPSK